MGAGRRWSKAKARTTGRGGAELPGKSIGINSPTGVGPAPSPGRQRLARHRNAVPIDGGCSGRLVDVDLIHFETYRVASLIGDRAADLLVEALGSHRFAANDAIHPGKRVSTAEG